jgi:hypothetical protein
MRARKRTRSLGEGWPSGEGNTEHSAIPRTAWNRIDLFDQPHSRFEPEDVGREREPTPLYSEVYVVAEEMIAIWPRNGASAERGRRVSLNGASDEDARRIIREAMLCRNFGIKMMWYLLSGLE